MILLALYEITLALLPSRPSPLAPPRPPLLVPDLPFSGLGWRRTPPISSGSLALFLPWWSFDAAAAPGPPLPPPSFILSKKLRTEKNLFLCSQPKRDGRLELEHVRYRNDIVPQLLLVEGERYE